MTKENLNCTNCQMRGLTLFANLPESSFQGLDFQPVVSQHAAQDVLIPQSSKFKEIFTIRKGIVKLESHIKDGSKRIVRLLSIGDTLGLQAWQIGKHQHEVVALTDVELCQIPYDTLASLQQRSVQLNQEVLQRCCNESLQADFWITHFSTGSVTRRMANLLLYLSELQNTPIQHQVKLMSRDDMAAILGVRQESISRTITQFKQDELITPMTRDVYLLNTDRLVKKTQNRNA